MAPLLSKKRIVQVKVEAAKGVAESATMLDALATDPSINATAEVIERSGGGAHLGNAHKSVLGQLSGEASLQLELRGNGTNAMDAAVAAMLTACGFKNTAEVYAPISTVTDQKSVTILQFTDGGKKSIIGAMGNVVIAADVGQRVMCSFAMQGAWVAPVAAALPTFAPSAELPPTFKSGTFTIGAAAVKIARFSLDMGATVVMRPDAATSSGIGHAMITDIKPVLTVDPEMDLVGTRDWYGLWLAGTTAVVQIVIGTGAGKRITIDIPVLQYRDLKQADRDGVETLDLTGDCLNNAGDDAVKITVTKA